MKIQTIEINNYKAFHGNYKINVGGKNLFIYGENGSGKNSLYNALKDFFQASFVRISTSMSWRIFFCLTAKRVMQESKVAIKLDGQRTLKYYQFSGTAIKILKLELS